MSDEKDKSVRTVHPECEFCKGHHALDNVVSCRNNLFHEVVPLREFVEGVKKDFASVLNDSLDPLNPLATIDPLLEQDEHNTPLRIDGMPNREVVVSDARIEGSTSHGVTPQVWGGFAEVPSEATGGRAFFTIEDKSEEGND